MSEYIDREDAIELARRNKAVCSCDADIVDVIEIVNHVPAADVKPVKHGKWKHFGSGSNMPLYCSRCEKTFPEYFKKNLNFVRTAVHGWTERMMNNGY